MHLEEKVDPAVKVEPAEARLLDLVVLVRNCRATRASAPSHVHVLTSRRRRTH